MFLGKNDYGVPSHINDLISGFNFIWNSANVIGENYLFTFYGLECLNKNIHFWHYLPVYNNILYIYKHGIWYVVHIMPDDIALRVSILIIYLQHTDRKHGLMSKGGKMSNK